MFTVQNKVTLIYGDIDIADRDFFNIIIPHARKIFNPSVKPDHIGDELLIAYTLRRYGFDYIVNITYIPVSLKIRFHVIGFFDEDNITSSVQVATNVKDISDYLERVLDMTRHIKVSGK